MYHVAPILSADEHRRLIGNDLAIIFFLDEGAEFDPSQVTALGKVPMIYIVVTPYQDAYRLVLHRSQFLKMNPILIFTTTGSRF